MLLGDILHCWAKNPGLKKNKTFFLFSLFSFFFRGGGGGGGGGGVGLRGGGILFFFAKNSDLK